MKEKRISVTEYGIWPGTMEDCSRPLALVLAKIKEIGEAVTLEFPTGEYHFYKECGTGRNYHTSNTDTLDYPVKTIGILLEGQQNLTVDGNGALFLFHGNMMALAVVDCENVTLKNFAWDYACGATQEMVIKRIEGNRVRYGLPAGQTFTVAENRIVWYEDSPLTGERYWQFENDEQACVVYVFDEVKGRLARHDLCEGPFFAVENIVSGKEVADDNGAWVEISYEEPLPAFYREGIRFEITRNAYRETAGAFIWQSKGTAVEEVTVHYLYGFGWLTQMSRDVCFRGCRFIPRPGTGRMCVSFADCIHVSGAGGEILIEDCQFTHAHDDAINIHGTFVKVERAVDEHTLSLVYSHRQQGGFPQVYPGDEVTIYRDDSLAPMGTFRAAEVMGPSAADGKRMRVRFAEKLPVELRAVIREETTKAETTKAETTKAETTGEKVTGVKVPAKLREGLASDHGYVAENITYTPSVIIRRCSFAALPTRGILCTTPKPVRITENDFRNITMSAIYLSGDSKEWFESGSIRDMVIRGNRFGAPSRSGNTVPPPAILIEPVTVSSVESFQAVHDHILICENRFGQSEGSSVTAARVRNLQIADNVYEVGFDDEV